MIDVSVTILKVDVHNIFLKCVDTNYEVEQKMKKKRPNCQASSYGNRVTCKEHIAPILTILTLPCNALFKKNMTRQ